MCKRNKCLKDRVISAEKCLSASGRLMYLHAQEVALRRLAAWLTS